MIGMTSWLRGEYERAIEFQERTAQAGRASGLPYLEAMGLCALGTAHLDISPDLFDKTSEFHSQSMKLMESPLGAVMGGLGGAWLLRACGGQSGGCRRPLQQGAHRVSTASKFLARPQLRVGAAFVALGQGDAAEAQRLVQEAREFAEERGMRFTYPMLGFAEGQISAVAGDPQQALEAFARGEELGLEMRMRPMVLNTRAGAAQVLAGLGRSDEAQANLGGAREMAEEIAGLFESEEMRRMYVDAAMKRLAPSS